MNHLSYLGTEYGGWSVNADLIPHKSTIISAGIGEDTSFDEALVQLKECSIIGIDPTEKSHAFVKQQDPPNFTLLKAALVGAPVANVKIFKQKNPTHVSESIIESNSQCSNEYYMAPTVTLNDLLSTYRQISLLKMDIEGAEYEIIENLTRSCAPQICVEFHHFCSHFTEKDTANCINKLKSMGYEFNYTPNGTDYTFITNKKLS